MIDVAQLDHDARQVSEFAAEVAAVARPATDPAGLVRTWISQAALVRRWPAVRALVRCRRSPPKANCSPRLATPPDAVGSTVRG